MLGAAKAYQAFISFLMHYDYLKVIIQSEKRILKAKEAADWSHIGVGYLVYL